MASTLTPTPFNIKITEEQVVRNSIIKSEVTYTISNVTNIDRRIVTCPNTTSIALFNVNGTNPGAGTFPSSSLKYVRVTNLDDTYNVAITLSGSQGELTQEIVPSSTLMLASSNITSSAFNGSLEDDIELVLAYAISGSVDVEYTIINA